MPFTSTIDPVLLQIGPLAVRYYGIAYALGFLFAWWWLRRAAKAGEIAMNDDSIADLVLWLIIGVVVGGRLGHVLLWNFPYFVAHPLKIFAIWEGGMAFHGGLVGVIVAALLFCRKRQLSFFHLADVLVIPASFALAIGRLANLTNGELYGPITALPWCVNFPSIDGCRHPYQIYSALMHLAVGFFLIWLPQKQKYREGLLFWLFLALSAIGRFFLDFFRVDTQWIGLSIGQYLSLVVFIVAAYVIVKYHQNDTKHPFSQRKTI